MYFCPLRFYKKIYEFYFDSIYFLLLFHLNTDTWIVYKFMTKISVHGIEIKGGYNYQQLRVIESVVYESESLAITELLSNLLLNPIIFNC